MPAFRMKKYPEAPATGGFLCKGQVRTMAKKRKRNTVRNVLIVAVLLGVLAAGCYFGGNYITQWRADRLAERQAEVEVINQQRSEEYAAELADFENQSSGGANQAWPTQQMVGWDVVDLTNYPLESPTSTSVTRAELMHGGMLLVNQWHSRPEDFSEDELVSVGTYSDGAIGVDKYSIQLFPNAIDALKEAVEAARAEGLEHYVVSEGYRSWDDQNTLFQSRMSKLSSKYSGDELIEVTKTYVNYPGTSEYNTGLSFTLHMYEKDNTQLNGSSFTDTDQGKWMCENCWKYGLVFRFPKYNYPLDGTMDKSYKTGVSVTLNLFRYVGKGNAAVMHAMDFCLEEYIDYLAEHPHIAVFEDGVLKYEIYRQYVGDAESISLELAGRASSWESSLDNMGYAVTVFSY